MNKFKGLGVAMITPFHADGSPQRIDFESLERLTNHLIDGGVSYLVVMGTTGENPTISGEEQQQILQKVSWQIVQTAEKTIEILFCIRFCLLFIVGCI